MTGQFVRFSVLRESAEFHCPACGVLISDADGTVSKSPCPHLLFIWFDDAGQFGAVAERMRAIVARVEDPLAPCAPWDEEFIAACPDGTVLFALTWDDSTNGIPATTALVGIDFGDMSAGEETFPSGTSVKKQGQAASPQKATPQRSRGAARGYAPAPAMLVARFAE
jgi:hypothetical protein